MQEIYFIQNYSNIWYIIIILGLLFFLSLITYSPNDPNFIFSENKEIKNF